MTADIARDLETKGFALFPRLVEPAELEALKATFSNADMARAERGGQTYGARNLLQLDEVRRLANSQKLGGAIRTVLGCDAQAVRGIFFDKTEAANWPVLWHQDLSLAVQEQKAFPGWSNWSVKRGVCHVQPPAEVLEAMVTVRLHLDDCPAENGALRVMAGSHRAGLLPRATITAMAAEGRFETVTASAGDALFMKPLILHASSPALSPSHRRVLHLEFAPSGLLPEGLEWAATA